MFANSFNAALASLSNRPLLQSFAIVIGTFILEDAATVLAAMRAEEGAIPASYAISALYIGIVLGDVGLYAFGRFSARTGFLRRLLPDREKNLARGWVEGRITKLVFASRFLPGARLPTYTSCGYLGASFWRFTLAAIAATLVWTSLLFVLSMSFGELVIDHLGQWRWAGAVTVACAVVLFGRLISQYLGKHA